MFGNLVSKAHEDDPFKVLDLVVCLWVRGCSWQTFSTLVGAHRSEDLSNGLSTIVSANVRLYALWDEPMIKEDISNVGGCCPERWDSSSQLRVLVGNDKYALMNL